MLRMTFVFGMAAVLAGAVGYATQAPRRRDHYDCGSREGACRSTARIRSGCKPEDGCRGQGARLDQGRDPCEGESLRSRTTARATPASPTPSTCSTTRATST